MSPLPMRQITLFPLGIQIYYRPLFPNLICNCRHLVVDNYCGFTFSYLSVADGCARDHQRFFKNNYRALPLLLLLILGPSDTDLLATISRQRYEASHPCDVILIPLFVVRLYLLFVAGKKGLFGIVRGLIEWTTAITLNGIPPIHICCTESNRPSFKALQKRLRKGNRRTVYLLFF